jgi:4-amino-4-deoxy-L-arabinose transferase-like glycosyltransferase
MNKSVRRNVYYLTLTFLGVIGVAIIVYTTNWGIGLFGRDSFNYISAARNLAKGLGYVFFLDNNTVAPITHYPPLLSIILAVFEFVGVDALVTVRYLNALLFGLSAMLTGILIYRATKSEGFSLLGTVLFLSVVVFIELHSWALSEPLFLFLTLLGFLLFDKYINRKKLATLFGLSVVLGLCFLTRYVGIANIATITLVTMVVGKSKVKRRLFDSAVIVAVSVTPVLLWTYRNYTLTQTINNRNIGLYPPVQKNLISTFHTFFTWYLPEKAVIGFERYYFYLLVVLGISIVVLIYRFRKHSIVIDLIQSIKHVHPLNLVYICYIAIYTGVIFFSKTFIDPGTGMSDRIFSPVLLVSILLAVNWLSHIWRSAHTIGRLLAILLSVYLFAFFISSSVATVPKLHENGLGLGKKSLQNSETMHLLSELAKDKDIYSNDPFAVYFYTGQRGFRRSAFSPDIIQDDEVIIAIFGASEGEAFYRKYSEYLELVQSDQVVSVFLFRPER